MGRLIRDNDPKALTELYNRYSQKLLGYFINMFNGDVEKGQDFLHDLFLRLMDKKHLFDTNRKFYSWIFTMASNMCKTEFRQPTIKTLTSEAMMDHLTEASRNSIDSRSFKLALKAEISQLSHDHRVVFILRYHQNFNLKDIADITETSYGTVKSRLFYATQKIAKSLKGYQPENDSPQFKIH